MIVISNKSIKFDSLIKLTKDDLSEKAKKIIKNHNKKSLYFDFKTNKIVDFSETNLFYKYMLTDQNNFDVQRNIESILDLCKQEYKLIMQSILEDGFLSIYKTDLKDLVSHKDFYDNFKKLYHNSDKIEIFKYLLENNNYFQNDFQDLTKVNNKYSATLKYVLSEDVQEFIKYLEKEPITFAIANMELLFKIVSFTKEEKELIKITFENIFNKVEGISNDNYQHFLRIMIELSGNTKYEEILLLNKNKFYETRAFFELNHATNGNYFINVDELLSQMKIQESSEYFSDQYENYDFIKRNEQFLNSNIFKNISKLVNIIEKNSYSKISFSTIQNKDKELLDDFICEIDTLFDIYQFPDENTETYINTAKHILNVFNSLWDDQYYVKTNDFSVYDENDGYIIIPF